MFNNRLENQIFSIILITIIIVSFCFVNPLLNYLSYSAHASSSWTQTTESDFTSGTLVNLSIIKDGKNESIRLESIESSLWKDLNLNYNPGLRQEHAMATIYGTDNILLFGGDKGDWWWWNTDDSTWLFDYSLDKWEEIYPINHPTPRTAHAMSTIDGVDKILLFGGSYGSNYDDTWIYDLSDNNWVKINPINKPSPRSDHAMTSIPGTDKVLLFGGTTNSYQTWIYDLSDGDWTQKYPSTSPSGREKHGMAQIFGTDKILLFGSNNPATNNETWIYDYSDNNWELVINKAEPIGTSNLGLTTIYGTDNILLFGGTLTNSDTWLYDHSENNWTKKSFSNPPVNRYSHSLASIYWTNNAVLWGGNSGGSHKNETWIYDYNNFKSEGIYESTIFDTKDLSEFKIINWTCILPTNTKIDFQIRSAKEITEISTKDFIGPNGSTTTYYSSQPTNIWEGHKGDRWIQYQVLFYTNNSHFSPILENVTIIYNCLPNANSLIPYDNEIINYNTPLFTWNFTDIDSKSQSMFQILVDNENTFEQIDFDSGEQSSNEQYWQFPDRTSYTEMSDGKWFWKIRIKDNDGGWSEYRTPQIFNIDSKTPYSSILFPQNGERYNSLTQISGNSNDQLNGVGVKSTEISLKYIDGNKYWNGSNWVSNKVWLQTTGISSWSYDSSEVNWFSGEEYVVHSRAIDNASNVEIPGEDITFTLDNFKPGSIIEIPESNSYLNQILTISGIANDINGTGVIKVEISIKNLDDGNYWNGTGWDANQKWLITEGTDSWSYNSGNVLWTSDLIYVINSRAFDLAGNIEIPESGNQFMFDNKAPEISIQINNGDEFTKSMEVVLFLSSEDQGSAVSRMKFSIDNITWADWEKINTSKNLTITEGDGNKSVFFVVEDLAGNTAIPVHDYIVLDTKPPRDLSLIINNGSIETDSINIDLEVFAFDELSGVSHMSFSEDDIYWSGWISYSETYQYRLTHGDGEKEIHFKVKDKAGNIANPVSVKIILNTSEPGLKPDDDTKPDDTHDTGPDDQLKDQTDDVTQFNNLIVISIFFVIIAVIIIVILFIKKRRKPARVEDGLDESVVESKETGQQISTQKGTPILSKEKIQTTIEPQSEISKLPHPSPQPISEISDTSINNLEIQRQQGQIPMVKGSIPTPEELKLVDIDSLQKTKPLENNTIIES